MILLPNSAPLVKSPGLVPVNSRHPLAKYVMWAYFMQPYGQGNVLGNNGTTIKARVFDHGRNALHGSVVAGVYPDIETGLYGREKQISFGTYVQVAYSPRLNVSNKSITIVARCKSTGTGPAQGDAYIAIRDWSGSVLGYYLSVGPASGAFNTAGIGFYNGATYASGVTTSIIADNKWHTVAGVARYLGTDSTEMSYYLDGRLDKQATVAKEMPTGVTDVLNIGQYVAASLSFVGSLDFVFALDTALGPAEVASLMADPYAILTPPRRAFAAIGIASTITGSGSLAAQSAALAGVAERAITGSGALAAQSATVAGVAERTAAGSGTLQAGSAAISGAGITGFRTITGSGALTAQRSYIAAASSRTIDGAGALQAGSAAMAGSGGRPPPINFGGGSLVARPATMDGVGVVVPLISECENCAQLIHFTPVATDPETLFYKDLDCAFVMDTGGAVTRITDPDYPAETVPGVAYIDGYVAVMTPEGEIHTSGLLNPTNWSALDFINAEVEPDGAVAIAKQLNYVVAFGEWTTEFFFNAANPAPGSPLSRVQNAALQIGCANGYSVIQADNALWYIAQTRQRGRQVMAMVGQTPQAVSSPHIERILNADDLGTVYAFPLRLCGHSWLIWTLKNSNVTIVFDATSRVWYRWAVSRPLPTKNVTSLTAADSVATATIPNHGFSDGDLVTFAGIATDGYNGDRIVSYVDTNTVTFIVAPDVASPATGSMTVRGYEESYFPFVAHVSAFNKDWLVHESDGGLYLISEEFYRDHDGYIDCRGRTRLEDQASMVRKFISSLTVVADEVDSDLWLRHSDSDYGPHSRFRAVDLASARPRLYRLSTGRRRNIEFRHQADTPLRLFAYEITVEPGSH